jgi:hypothetical protein
LLIPARKSHLPSTREDGDGKANQRKVSERVRKGDIDDRSTREDGD